MALTAACDPKRSFNVGRFDCKLDVSLVGEASTHRQTWLAASAYGTLEEDAAETSRSGGSAVARPVLANRRRVMAVRFF